MIKSQIEQTIERPAADVWAYAADIVRHPEWMSVTDASLLQGNGSAVGSRGRERMALGPFKWDVEFQVAEAVPGRRIVWRSITGAPFDLEVALDLEPAGPASTRARYGAAIQPHGLWRLLTPLIAMEGKTGPERELQRLKANVEMRAAPVATAS
ncbi:MAG: SRPBCC family protein [Chloroflexi bacterium]|nr:SRPBCC family protein [Chloroflexota bacterium]